MKQVFFVVVVRLLCFFFMQLIDVSGKEVVRRKDFFSIWFGDFLMDFF